MDTTYTFKRLENLASDCGILYINRRTNAGRSLHAIPNSFIRVKIICVSLQSFAL